MPLPSADVQQQQRARMRRREPGVLAVEVEGADVTLNLHLMTSDLRHAIDVVHNYRCDGMVLLPMLGAMIRVALIALGLVARTPSMVILQVALLASELALVPAFFFFSRWLMFVVFYEMLSLGFEFAHYWVWLFVFGGRATGTAIFWSVTVLTATRLAVSIAVIVAAVSIGGAVRARDRMLTQMDALKAYAQTARPKGGTGIRQGPPVEAAPPLQPPRPTIAPPPPIAPAPDLSQPPPPEPMPMPPQQAPVQAILGELSTPEAGALVLARLESAGLKLD
jgi:hypothetical protein